MRTISLALTTIFLATVLQPSAWGQGTSASLTGLVSDSSQAIVHGATVKITNLSTNIVRSTTTDAAGYYNFPSLAVGEYEVSVENNLALRRPARGSRSTLRNMRARTSH
jgi:hypothetical protein